MDPNREKFLEIFHSLDFHKIKDHPNILIAANFWEEDRYCAAKLCYKFMRSIDDLIDNHKEVNCLIKPGERGEFKKTVEEWLHMIVSSAECNPLQKELTEIIQKFRIPLWPLEAFAKSMVYDIYHDGFPSLDSFLEYSEGASVAPASIFVHLNSLVKRGDHYESPAFDVKEVATPCAIFSYLVHIIRDFRKDQLNHLSYFAEDLIIRHGLTREKMREFAEGKPVDDNFRELIRVHYELADHYRVKTYDMIRRIRPFLEPRYQLSLEIIFNLYLMTFERINLSKGTFTSEELNPTPEETRERVYDTIMQFHPEPSLMSLV